MGICFSTMKKRKEPSSSSSSSSPPPPPPPTVEPSPTPPPPPPAHAPIPIPRDPNTEQPKDPPPPSLSQKPQTSKPEDNTQCTKPLFLTTPSMTQKPTSPEAPPPSAAAVVHPSPLDDPLPVIAPPRTSSCTKEEVESILIQCGRLSRSSSGDADGNGRRYSGSKRSFDFDSDRRVEGGEDWERSLLHQSSSSRPSPRRRAHSRERDGGGRRVSRSPARRTEQSVASGGPRQQQQLPGKMVSVPAREKSSSSSGSNNASSAESGGIGARRNQWSSGHGSNGPVRSSSPRSRSPGIVRMVANENYCHVQGGGGNNNGGHQQQPLSRSSSRKPEQSPYRRNPMAEIDENCVRGEQQPPVGDQGLRKKKKGVTQTVPQRTKSEQREEPNTPSRTTREQLKSCRPEEGVPRRQQQEISEEQQHQPPRPPVDAKAISITRSRSSRRSSRDLDAILSNPPSSSYASQLLEDIHNYHQQNGASAAAAVAPFSLPACVSKACSILEAVADLNNNDGFSSTGQQGSTQKQTFAEPKVEQSLHKYVSVRNKVVVVETEPQESAGSNSFVGQQQQWVAGTCEGNTAESPSDRCWTSSWSRQDEQVEGDGSRCNGQRGGGGGGGGGNGGRRGELENQRRVRRGMSGIGGGGGGRASSAPVGGVAAAASVASS